MKKPSNNHRYLGEDRYSTFNEKIVKTKCNQNLISTNCSGKELVFFNYFEILKHFLTFKMDSYLK